VESLKGVFYARHIAGAPLARRRPPRVRRIHRRAARFNTFRARQPSAH